MEFTEAHLPTRLNHRACQVCERSSQDPSVPEDSLDGTSGRCADAQFRALVAFVHYTRTSGTSTQCNKINNALQGETQYKQPALSARKRIADNQRLGQKRNDKRAQRQKRITRKTRIVCEKGRQELRSTRHKRMKKWRCQSKHYPTASQIRPQPDYCSSRCVMSFFPSIRRSSDRDAYFVASSSYAFATARNPMSASLPSGMRMGGSGMVATVS